MNCLIIEDEKIAANRLIELIHRLDSSINIISVLQSIKSVSEWFIANTTPDLIFMDIQLADGLSFEIFEQVPVDAPIIFTTAFDEYALKAFKLNSIDYLLKPIDFDELSSALSKFFNNRKSVQYPPQVFDNVLKSLTNQFKSKFVVKVGEHIRVFKVDEISCFYSMEKSSFLQNNMGRDYAISYSLDQLEELLDPHKFFRISRKYIIAFSSIEDIVSYSNSRLLLKLNFNDNDDLIVSRERVQKFKEWLEN